MTAAFLDSERARSVLTCKLANLLRAAEADRGRHGAEAWRRKLEPLMLALQDLNRSVVPAELERNHSPGAPRRYPHHGTATLPAC